MASRFVMSVATRFAMALASRFLTDQDGFARPMSRFVMSVRRLNMIAYRFITSIGPSISSPSFEGPLHLPVQLPARYALSLVEVLLALHKSELDLCVLALEIHAEWHKSEAPFIDFSRKSTDFLPVEQQFPYSQGIVIEMARFIVWIYVHVVQKDLSAFNGGITVLDICLARAQGFDFTACQSYPRLHGFENEV